MAFRRRRHPAPDRSLERRLLSRSPFIVRLCSKSAERPDRPGRQACASSTTAARPSRCVARCHRSGRGAATCQAASPARGRSRHGRRHQRRNAALGLVGLQPAVLDAMRHEVVGITPTPRGLRSRAASDLTRRCRTRALATADAAVRHKPPTADAAGPLREHPEMLGSSAGHQGGPLLPSNPGSILASAEGRTGP